MITDRTEQLERPAATRPHASMPRPVLRRRHVAAAPASAAAHAQDMRMSVAVAFRAVANGIDPNAAQAQAATFYRSSGQEWARALDNAAEPVSRARIAAAFRAMAHGVDPNPASAAMLRFYRSSGHDWTRSLSEAA